MLHTTRGRFIVNTSTHPRSHACFQHSVNTYCCTYCTLPCSPMLSHVFCAESENLSYTLLCKYTSWRFVFTFISRHNSSQKHIHYNIIYNIITYICHKFVILNSMLLASCRLSGHVQTCIYVTPYLSCHCRLLGRCCVWSPAPRSARCQRTPHCSGGREAHGPGPPCPAGSPADPAPAARPRGSATPSRRPGRWRGSATWSASAGWAGAALERLEEP